MSKEQAEQKGLPIMTRPFNKRDAQIGDGMAFCSMSIPEDEEEEHLEKMIKLAISSGLYVKYEKGEGKDE